MPKYRIETEVTVRRIYFLKADSEADARRLLAQHGAGACTTTAEEDENEEVSLVMQVADDEPEDFDPAVAHFGENARTNPGYGD
jgi:hypothetical protein